MVLISRRSVSLYSFFFYALDLLRSLSASLWLIYTAGKRGTRSVSVFLVVIVQFNWSNISFAFHLQYSAQ